MKVIAINGSPKTNGNTSVLLGKVCDELNREGIETEVLNVGNKPVKGCIDCRKCFENKDNRCVISNDPFNDYVQRIVDADGIILGSPVYFADVSGQMKNFIDRLGLVALANGFLVRKVGASVVAVRRGGALHAYHTMNSLFGICQMVTVGSSYWNFAFGELAGEVLKDEEGMQTMQNVGKNMAWILKAIEKAE